MNASSSDLWIASLKTLGMLSVVLSIVLLFFFLIKKLSFRNAYNQTNIQIISSLYIGPRKQIVLIDVMNEKLVLGVTTERITCLAKLDNTQEGNNVQNDQTNSSNIFNKILSKTKNNEKNIDILNEISENQKNNGNQA